VLEALLAKYEDDGIVDLGNPRVLQLPPLDTIGRPVELVREFGGKAGFERAVHELQDMLYEAS
jgi:type I restriction enzyme, R subunit